MEYFNLGDEVWILQNRKLGIGDVNVSHVVKATIYCRETKQNQYKSGEISTHVDYHVEYVENGETHDTSVYASWVYPTKEEAQRKAYELNERKVKLIEDRLKQLNDQQEKLNAD